MNRRYIDVIIAGAGLQSFYGTLLVFEQGMTFLTRMFFFIDFIIFDRS